MEEDEHSHDFWSLAQFGDRQRLDRHRLQHRQTTDEIRVDHPRQKTRKLTPPNCFKIQNSGEFSDPPEMRYIAATMPQTSQK